MTGVILQKSDEETNRQNEQKKKRNKERKKETVGNIGMKRKRGGERVRQSAVGHRSRPKVTFTFTFSRRFCPKRRTRERIFKLRAIEPGVTINKYYFTLEI